MILKFDHFNRATPPLLYLHNPGGKRVAPIPEGSYTGLRIKIVFNGVSELSLDVYKYLSGIGHNKIELDAYQYIQGRRQIYVNDLGYFIIQSIDETDDGENPCKTIDAVSCEIEIDDKGIVLQEGVYQFYSHTNPENTIMGMVMEKLPNWSIGRIPDALLTRYRHFDDLTSQLYSFLTNEVQEPYNCIFDFDIKNRIINVIDADEGIQSTDIFLSHENLINELKTQTDIEESVTALEILGGEDLDIGAVNPIGGNVIYNFDYVKSTEWMDQALIDRLCSWEEKTAENQELFTDTFTAYRQKNTELLSLKSALVKPEADLKSAEMIYSSLVASSADESRINSKWEEIKTLRNTVNEMKAAIQMKQEEVDACLTQLSSITEALSFEHNFSSDELARLSPFIKQKQYIDENIIVTEAMTDNERLSCIEELYEKGKKKLSELVEPMESFQIDCDNFLFIKEFDRFREQLETGRLIHAQMENGYIVHLALTSYELSFDDAKLSLTMGNKYKQSDPYSRYADIYSSVSKSASTVSSKRKLWDKPFQNNKFVQYDAALNQSIDLSSKAIVNSGNQSITQDHRGIILRAPKDPSHPELGYNSGQMWLTNNGMLLTQEAFEDISDHQLSPSVAVGNIILPAGTPYIDDEGKKQAYDEATTVYGINAELLYGKLTLSQNLIVTGLISGNIIEANTLNASSIIAGSITSREIDAGAITADKIDANAVSGEKIDARNLIVSNETGDVTLSIDNAGDVSLNVKSLSIAGAEIAKQEDLDKLQIGSRNYIKDSVSCVIAAPDSQFKHLNLCALEPGTQYTFSVGRVVRVAGIAAQVSLLVYDYANNFAAASYTLDVSDSKQQITFHSPAISPAEGSYSLLVYAGLSGSTQGNIIRYERLKLEKGSRETDWTPALNDPAYAANLILNSKKEETSNAYGFAGKDLIAQLIEGQKYTLSFCGHIDQQAKNDGKSLACYVYASDWSFSIKASLDSTSDSTASVSFVASKTGTYRFMAYLFPDGGSRMGKATLKWCKLEVGDQATDWTPAVEDRAYLVNTLSPTQADGLWLGDDGRLNMTATQIKAGKLQAKNGESYFDLDNGNAQLTGVFTAKSPTQDTSSGTGSSATMRGFEITESSLAPAGMYFSDVWGNSYGSIYGIAFGNGGNRASFTSVLIAEKSGAQIQLNNNYVMVSGTLETSDIEAKSHIRMTTNDRAITGTTTGDKQEVLVQKSASNNAIYGHSIQTADTNIYTRTGGRINFMNGTRCVAYIDGSGWHTA